MYGINRTGLEISSSVCETKSMPTYPVVTRIAAAGRGGFSV